MHFESICLHRYSSCISFTQAIWCSSRTLKVDRYKLQHGQPQRRFKNPFSKLQKTLQELSGFRLGDKVTIQSSLAQVDAASVVLEEILPTESLELSNSIVNEDNTYWLWFLELPLRKAEFLSVNLLLQDVELKGQKRSFKVVQINDSSDPGKIYRYQAETSLRFGTNPGVNVSAGLPLRVAKEGIGGLEKQLEQLNEHLSAFGDDRLHIKLPSYYRPRRGGILLHGQPGTGKTFVPQQGCTMSVEASPPHRHRSHTIKKCKPWNSNQSSLL